MTFLSRSLGVAALSTLMLCSLAPALAQAPLQPAAPPPVSAFFGNSPFGTAKLSPSARYLAMRTGAPGKRDSLLVVDLQANSGKVVASYSDADVGNFRWVNDERLIFDTHEKGIGLGDKRYAPGLYAVDRDGGRQIELAGRTTARNTGTRTARKLLPLASFMFGQDTRQDSDFTYAVTPTYDTRGELRYVDLLRVNTVTGQYTTVPRPGDAVGWLLDQAGEPRLAVTYRDATNTLHYREPANGQWRALISFPAFGDGALALQPLGFTSAGTLLVVARGKNGMTAVHNFDIASARLDPQPLLSAAGYDFDGDLVVNRDKVLGVLFRTDAVSNEWFDTGMKAVQQDIDKLLPATVNVLSVPAQGDSPTVLVRAYSDAVPSTYFLYDTQAKRLNKVGESRPGIQPAQMGRQQFVRYRARDGLDIPALLTLPPGAKAGKGKQGEKLLPLVVMVHGGPYVRGNSWGWDPASQFLATRGYAVLEPEFRGSMGFGVKHLRAGFKQWGLAMQNDLADGVRWAIDQGIVDPARVCIAGASYGGYATLMGLVNDPDLYKCGVNWVGVTDIGLLFDNGWGFSDDVSRDAKQYSMPEMIGDPDKDAEQFKATSPIRLAPRITQPLLLAYGGVDRRVPINHGTAFRNAVMKTNGDVEWVEYPEEGHGWALEKNNLDFWGRVEKFLDRNIGKGAASR